MPDEQPPPDPASEPDKETPAERQERSALQQVAKYGELGFLLPACTFVGWAIGAALDRWLGKHGLTLAGVLFGIVVGFVQMIRVALRASR